MSRKRNCQYLNRRRVESAWGLRGKTVLSFAISQYIGSPQSMSRTGVLQSLPPPLCLGLAFFILCGTNKTSHSPETPRSTLTLYRFKRSLTPPSWSIVQRNLQQHDLDHNHDHCLYQQRNVISRTGPVKYFENRGC